MLALNLQMRVFLGSIWLAGPGVPLAFPVTARKVDAASQTAEVLGFGQAIPIAVVWDRFDSKEGS